MPLSDKMLKELMATFQTELQEHLSMLTKDLLSLERNPTSNERTNLLTNIFRAAHSIKGAARTVNLKDIETISHRIEDVLVKIRQGCLSLTPHLFDVLLTAVDAIGNAMAAHLRGEQMPSEVMATVLARLDDTVRGQAESGATQATIETSRGEKSLAPEPSAPMSLDSEAIPATSHANTPPTTAEPYGQSPCLPVEDGVSTQVGQSSSHPSGATSPVNSRADQPTAGTFIPPTNAGGSSAAGGKDQPPIGPRPIEVDDTIRVRTTKLDALMDGLGELLVMQMRTEKLLAQMKALQQRTMRWQKNWRKARPHCNRLRRHCSKTDRTDLTPLFDFLESNEEELKALGTEHNTLLDHLTNDRNHLQIITDDLQNGIRSARMLPITTLFDLFPRMVRDLAHNQSKDIVLEVQGQEAEVDRQALELMKDPLTHLLRNAVDHGIEPPEERLAAGKPRHGTIRLCAEQRGSNLVLTVSDDGRGINLDAVRRAAMKQGLVPSEMMTDLSEREVIDLIFHSGLSTAGQITDLSGRGVGMDVVRKNLEQIHGLIQVETRPGVGTTFILMLPLTLTTSQVLLVRVAGETVALPMINVERILHVNAAKVGSLEGHSAIYAEGRPLPLVSLANVLKLSEVEQPLPPDAKIPVVILSVAEKRVALRAGGFLSTQQVVLKSLGGQLRRVRNVAGAAILGDGQLVTILNVSDLMRSFHTKSVASLGLPIVTKKPRRWRVLLADDSITTRTLEKHILENAGYEVLTAADGQEAWELICQKEKGLPDLVVSDINMPRMDGFVLTQSIKGDSSYARVPVVLVTSLESPQDRLHGMEAGADAYFVKSTFDQRELLETIERLIK
jgi:two-component system, chemotaxis family, sensor kinase CheA